MGIHTCSKCKKDFAWSPQSSWYGSLIELEDRTIEKACSIDCGMKLWGKDYIYKIDNKPFEKK